MQTEKVKIGSLKPDPENVRLHGRESIDAIAASLKEYGQVKPIVVRKGIVIAGNGTMEAAKQLGWPTILIVRADHLTDDQARAYSIADNKTTDLSMFDYERLSNQLRDLGDRGVDLAATGFRTHELEPLLQADWVPPEAEALPEAGEDEQCHCVRFSHEQWAMIEGNLPPGKSDSERIAKVVLSQVRAEPRRLVPARRR